MYSPTYLPIYPPTYLPTYLPAYLPTYKKIHTNYLQISSALELYYALCNKSRLESELLTGNHSPDKELPTLPYPTLHVCSFLFWYPVEVCFGMSCRPFRYTVGSPLRPILDYMSCSMTKPTKWPVCPAKTQISQCIRPVWSVFAVCLKKHWVLGYPLRAQRRQNRLIWVSSGCTGHFVGFVTLRLIWSPFRSFPGSVLVCSGPFRFASVNRDTPTEYLPYPTVCCLILSYATVSTHLSYLPAAGSKVKKGRNRPANWTETTKEENDPGQNNPGRINRVLKWLRAETT